MLVVVAHPDDEALGCGGTIAKEAARGRAVVVAFASDGVTSRRDLPDLAMRVDARRVAAQNASSVLGISETRFFGYPDNMLDTVPLLEVARHVESLISEFEPATVITHFGGDLNVDHRVTHEAVVTACRPLPASPVKTLLTFETASSTEWRPPTSAAMSFQPNWYVDIAETLGSKLLALECYAEEMRPWPHPRSIEGVRHLALWRGASVGRLAAEAFALARLVA